jgi:hypothetical protein
MPPSCWHLLRRLRRNGGRRKVGANRTDFAHRAKPRNKNATANTVPSMVLLDAFNSGIRLVPASVAATPHHQDELLKI